MTFVSVRNFVGNGTGPIAMSQPRRGEIAKVGYHKSMMKQPTDSSQFYAKLHANTNFAQITNPEVYEPVPNDWFVIISDIQGSTVAIESGKYKAVNCVGAATIISVLNLSGGAGHNSETVEIPYIFGGDGATLLIPPQMRTRALQALAATREMAKSQFQLTLRVGCVPMSMLAQHGHSFEVAKFQTSPHIHQAAFSGSGLAYAEMLVKDPDPQNPFRSFEVPASNSGFDGLECRWQPIPHKNGEILSLVVKANSEDPNKIKSVYDKVIDSIESIYGHTDSLNPVRTDALRVNLKASELMIEAKIRQAGKGILKRIQYTGKIWLINVIWKRIFKNRSVAFGIDWGRYQDEVITNSDYRKFDGTLRMVIDGTAQQRGRLEAYLSEQQGKGVLLFGIHTSDSALLTCLVLNREGNHIHFVDGNNGGYAIAALALKGRAIEAKAKLEHEVAETEQSSLRARGA